MLRHDQPLVRSSHDQRLASEKWRRDNLKILVALRKAVFEESYFCSSSTLDLFVSGSPSASSGR